MSKADFDVMWQLYKDLKKSSGERNTDLLVDMMEAKEGFHMDKEIWNEFIAIMRDYSKLQYQTSPSKYTAREHSWICYRYNQYRNEQSMAVGEAKQKIADEFGFSFDKVHKVIRDKFKDYSEKLKNK